MDGNKHCRFVNGGKSYENSKKAVLGDSLLERSITRRIEA